MKQFRVPRPFETLEWLPEEQARKYISSIIDERSYLWLARRIVFSEEAFDLVLETRFCETLREALGWALWVPHMLDAAGLDGFQATCFLSELDLLVWTSEPVSGASLIVPEIWEKLGAMLVARPQ